MVKIVTDIFQKYEDNINGNLNVVLWLRSHKKKALLFALPNLCMVTGAAYTIPNIRKGFIYNGQLDPELARIPSFRIIINTFNKGCVSDCCLSDRKKFISHYFEEM